MRLLRVLLALGLIALAWAPSCLFPENDRIHWLGSLFGIAPSWLLWFTPVVLGLAWAAYSARDRGRGCSWLLLLCALPLVWLGYQILWGLGSQVPETLAGMLLASGAIYPLEAVASALLWFRFRRGANAGARAATRQPAPAWAAGLAPALVLSLAVAVPAVDAVQLHNSLLQQTLIPLATRQGWAAEAQAELGFQRYPGATITEETYPGHPVVYKLSFSTPDPSTQVFAYYQAVAHASGRQTRMAPDRRTRSGSALVILDLPRKLQMRVSKWGGDRYLLEISVNDTYVRDMLQHQRTRQAAE